MKYQLINEINTEYNTIEQILYNRGIPPSQFNTYMNTTDKDINSYLLLGEDNLKKAVKELIKCVNNNELAFILIDPDCDGYTSSALLINYLHDIFPTWVEQKLEWNVHEGKQHGLDDFIDTLENSDYSLIICPDSSSNNYEAHKRLKEKGKTIIVLDHHEAEKISNDAIIINNQLSNYPNKFLSGVGITWQFCKYIDNYLLNYKYADKYLDLVALGLIADVMDMRSIETKHLINKGLQNINNPFFLKMVEKQDYSLKGKITPIGIAWYIAPYINAMVRSGTIDEKKLLFKSMLNFHAFDMVLSNKRGHKPEEQEKLVDQAIRTVVNVKNRQTTAVDKGMQFLEEKIVKENLLKNKVLLFLLKPGQISPNIAGLIANKLMSKYQRPCCILTETDEGYQGSARGCEIAGVNNFKEICRETRLTNYEEGHQSAFGLGLLKQNVDLFLQETNSILANISNEPIYYVDYIYNNTEINKQNIIDIANLDNLWGQGISESYIAIEHLKISKDMVTIYAKSANTLKISLPNKIELIKFKASEEECELLQTKNEGYVELEIVGRASLNEWNGNITPQIIIENYNIIKLNKYYF